MGSHQDHSEVPDFEVWFRANAGELLRYALFVAPDRAKAEDIAQDAAVKVFKAWASEDLRERIITSAAYVRRIVENCFLDYRKVRSRANEREEGHEGEEAGGVEPAVESDLDVRAALLRLVGDERDMLFLTYYQDLRIADAGRQLGISGTGAYRLHERALRHLAALLNEEEG